MKLTSLEFYKRRPKPGAEISPKPQGSILLASINKIQRDLSKYPQPYSFQMVCSDRVLAVQADSKSDMEMWIDEINDAIRAVKLGLTSGTVQLGGAASKTVGRRATIAGASADQAPVNKINFSEEFQRIRDTAKKDTEQETNARNTRSSVVGLYGLEKPNVSPKFEEKPEQSKGPKTPLNNLNEKKLGKDTSGEDEKPIVVAEIAKSDTITESKNSIDNDLKDKRTFFKTLSTVQRVEDEKMPVTDNDDVEELASKASSSILPSADSTKAT